jgi:hypothetical protein
MGVRTFDKTKYLKELVEVDKFLVKWYCPLNHLDVQTFYDLLCCKPFWPALAKALELGGLDTTGLDAANADAGILWQVLGLAAFDPWKNVDPAREGNPGFRQLLRANIDAVDGFGFKLSPNYKQMIAGALAKPGMLDALQHVAMQYDPDSSPMLTFRAAYPRMKEVQMPPGWVNLAL